MIFCLLASGCIAKYLVMLKKEASHSADGRQIWPKEISSHETSHVFSRLGVFHTQALSEEEAEQLRRQPHVHHVEPDHPVFAAMEANVVAENFKSVTPDTVSQRDAPWGLSRLSSVETIGRGHRFLFPKDGGRGVDVYVLDTGVYVKHSEFGGRASWGITVPEGEQSTDSNGHGTHCAATIAGRTFGVAKCANIIAVKVLRSDGTGQSSDVLRGIEWVLHRAEQTGRPSVINMSLGGERSEIVNEAVALATSLGVPIVAAAGNESSNACHTSPASSVHAITVAASDRWDRAAYMSNYGECVNIYAPGIDVLSAWIGGAAARRRTSGTSMAAPVTCLS